MTFDIPRRAWQAGAGATGAAGAAGTAEDILHVGQNKACKVQEISDHLAFDADVQGRIRVEAWGNVDFQDPGLQVFIQHDVKTKEFMAAVGAPHIQLQ